MEVQIVSVRPGTPSVVGAVVAGVRLEAQWAGPPAQPGELIDIEIGIDRELAWDETITLAGAESTLRAGPRLPGTVEADEQHVLVLRIGTGLVQVEVTGGAREVPPGTAVVVIAEPVTLYPTGI